MKKHVVWRIWASICGLFFAGGGMWNFCLKPSINTTVITIGLISFGIIFVFAIFYLTRGSEEARQ